MRGVFARVPQGILSLLVLSRVEGSKDVLPVPESRIASIEEARRTLEEKT